MVRDLNVDFLRGFADHERDVCEACGGHAAVSFPEVESRFCLACGAVWLHGRRLDEAGVLTVSLADDLR